MSEPWHQWGSSQTAIMLGLGGVSAPQGVPANQIVQVEYKYPVTWSFNIACRVSYQDPAGAPALNAVFVDLFCQWGVGRSNFRMDPFARFGFSAVQMQSAILSQRVADSVQLEPLDPFTSFDPPAPFQPAPNILRTLSAQSIQMGAVLYSTGAQTAGSTIVAEVTAYVAPMTHVRPEWFAGRLGPELGGR